MIIRKKFPLAIVFMLLMAAFFTSCDRDEYGEMDEMVQANNQQTSFVAAAHASDGDGGTALGELDCFAITYPISIIFPDGTSIAVDSDDALETTIEDWYEQNEDNPADPTLQFPIEVTLADGNIQSINDEETLCELFETCYDEDDDEDEDGDDDEDHDDCEFEIEDCFEPTFPLTLVLPDGAQTEVNDLDALEEAIENYYDQNPDDENEPSFIYPIEATLDDGSMIMLNNDEELIALLETCEDEDDDDDEHEEDCFDFVYPITINFPDGSALSVNSYEELDAAAEAYEDQNPDGDDDISLAYPVSIIFEDGSTAVIDNDDALDEAEDSCE